jgi:hypothetical protein
MTMKKITAAHYFEMLGAGPPAATSDYGFLGEPMGFKSYRGKLAPGFTPFWRWPGFDDEFYEGDAPWTVEEFRDAVWEWETDDRDTEKMVATAEWVRLHPNEKPKPSATCSTNINDCISKCAGGQVEVVPVV